MKTKITQCDSIIFDMDGTLWDGVECYTQGFNDYFKSKAILRTMERIELDGLMGLEEDAVLEKIFPHVPVDKRKGIYQEVINFQYKRITNGEGSLYNGVKDGLRILSGKFKLFIVSNCAEFTIDHFVEWAGIGDFITDSMAHAQNYKPKHENIKLIINKYKLKSPMYVGDTESDGKQSRLAGVPFAFVDYGFGKTLKYDVRFSSFPELVDYFQQIKL